MDFEPALYLCHCFTSVLSRDFSWSVHIIYFEGDDVVVVCGEESSLAGDPSEISQTHTCQVPCGCRHSEEVPSGEVNVSSTEAALPLRVPTVSTGHHLGGWGQWEELVATWLHGFLSHSPLVVC